MTEYNLFCTAEDKNRDWFQRPRFQVFNTQITEEEYGEIKIPNHKLEFNNNESYKTRFQTAFKNMWVTLTEEQKQEYFNIPHFNWAIFTDITGIEGEERVKENKSDQSNGKIIVHWVEYDVLLIPKL